MVCTKESVQQKEIPGHKASTRAIPTFLSSANIVTLGSRDVLFANWLPSLGVPLLGLQNVMDEPQNVMLFTNDFINHYERT